MIELKEVFSGFSVKNIEKAREFYVEVLGLDLSDENMGLELALPHGGTIFIYEKPDHKPAEYTILNFVVEDIDSAVASLKEHGITFESYDLGNGATQDEDGIMRGIEAHMGPDIAWFKDPSGNILSVLQNA